MEFKICTRSHLFVVFLALGALPSQLRGENICSGGFELQLGPRSVITGEWCKDGDKSRLRKPHLPRQPHCTGTSIMSKRQDHKHKDISRHDLQPHLATENSWWDI